MLTDLVTSGTPALVPSIVSDGSQACLIDARNGTYSRDLWAMAIRWTENLHQHMGRPHHRGRAGSQPDR